MNSFDGLTGTEGLVGMEQDPALIERVLSAAMEKINRLEEEALENRRWADELTRKTEELVKKTDSLLATVCRMEGEVQ